jgi:predicted nucleotidyltransferase
MVANADSIELAVQRFLDLVSRQIRIESAYIFGSQAQGKASPESDIDVAVISRDFAGNKFDAHLSLMKLAAQVDSRIEPCPFFTEEFDVNDPLVYEIRRTGRRVL